MKLKLYNTAHKVKEVFEPISGKNVKLYTCGPTVYDYAHIGNLRSYVFEDILKRTLFFNGYKVKHVMNITDVGHLTSDADQGDDKMEIMAQKEKTSVADIAQKFTDQFLKDLNKLNVIESDILAKATDYVKEQILFISRLEKKGYTYVIDDGVYFDTSKFPDYAQFARIDIGGLKEGARVIKNTDKNNVTDFALWKFSKKDKQRLQEWDSPWGIGFPGWHIECSTISMKFLGEQLDIHTGGIEHIPIHHTNEIAQSESLTGKRFVKYWMHNEHLFFDGKKMSKSKGNYATLNDVIDKGFSPLAYRHLLLTAHYRSKMNFTWQSLGSSQHFLDNFYKRLSELPNPTNVNSDYLDKFTRAINDDLNTPKALAIMQKLLKSNLDEDSKSATLLEFDEIFGLDMKKYIHKKTSTPRKIKILLNQRKRARSEGNYQESDKLRDKILELGFEVKDTPLGQKLIKI
mgnify:CR=1 FL=1